MPDPTDPSPIPPIAPLSPGPTTSAAGRLVDPSVSQSDRTYCMIMQLSILLMSVLLTFAIIIPLVMWISRKGESAFIDDHGKETLNFHITINIYLLISTLLLPLLCFSIPLYVAVAVLGIVGSILGGIAAGRGEFFRHPMCIRFIR